MKNDANPDKAPKATRLFLDDPRINDALIPTHLGTKCIVTELSPIIGNCYTDEKGIKVSEVGYRSFPKEMRQHTFKPTQDFEELKPFPLELLAEMTQQASLQRLEPALPSYGCSWATCQHPSQEGRVFSQPARMLCRSLKRVPISLKQNFSLFFAREHFSDVASRRRTGTRTIGSTRTTRPKL